MGIILCLFQSMLAGKPLQVLIGIITANIT